MYTNLDGRPYSLSRSPGLLECVVHRGGGDRHTLRHTIRRKNVTVIKGIPENKQQTLGVVSRMVVCI